MENGAVTVWVEYLLNLEAVAFAKCYPKTVTFSSNFRTIGEIRMIYLALVYPVPNFQNLLVNRRG
jgi:hypothetical protein